MPSIVDMIAQSENEAENIRKEAQEKAKALISEASDDCAKNERLAAEEVKRLMVFRKESAHHSADALCANIISKRRAESEQNAHVAEKNTDKAVKYIIERVTNL